MTAKRGFFQYHLSTRVLRVIHRGSVTWKKQQVRHNHWPVVLTKRAFQRGAACISPIRAPTPPLATHAAVKSWTNQHSVKIN